MPNGRRGKYLGQDAAKAAVSAAGGNSRDAISRATYRAPCPLMLSKSQRGFKRLESDEKAEGSPELSLVGSEDYN